MKKINKIFKRIWNSILNLPQSVANNIRNYKNMTAKEKKRELRLWAFLLSGSILIALSFVIFFDPYNLTPGGVYGAGVALNKLIPSVQTGTWGLILDIPLLLCAFIFFGGGFGSKTVISALTIPIVMNSMQYFIGSKVPSEMFGGNFDLSGDMFMVCLIGGVILGAGVAFILKSHATSGGTDILAMIVSKYMKIPISRAILLVDSFIVVFGLIAIGDWKVPLYSLLTIFIFTKVIDVILDGGSSDKLLFILTEKTERVRSYILDDLSRGGTLIKSAGMYSGADKEMIFVVVDRSEAPMIQDFVRQEDPKAFMVIVNAHETLGDGFREFTKPIGG